MKLYFDEDSADRQLIAALRTGGLDVESSPEAGMNGAVDEVQLAWATSRGRLIVTSNARDFVRLHSEWAGQGRSHAGILILTQQRYTKGEIVRRLLRMRDTRVEIANRLHFISSF